MVEKSMHFLPDISPSGFIFRLRWDFKKVMEE